MLRSIVDTHDITSSNTSSSDSCSVPSLPPPPLPPPLVSTEAASEAASTRAAVTSDPELSDAKAPEAEDGRRLRRAPDTSGAGPSIQRRKLNLKANAQSTCSICSFKS